MEHLTHASSGSCVRACIERLTQASSGSSVTACISQHTTVYGTRLDASPRLPRVRWLLQLRCRCTSRHNPHVASLCAILCDPNCQVPAPQRAFRTAAGRKVSRPFQPHDQASIASRTCHMCYVPRGFWSVRALSTHALSSARTADNTVSPFHLEHTALYARRLATGWWMPLTRVNLAQLKQQIAL